jgi:uncharacterized membrane protein YfcA
MIAPTISLLGPASWFSILVAIGVGFMSGATSGLWGISPGGALVVLSTVFLGAEQHVAQGISLAAQVPPTSLSGIRRYREGGSACPTPWILWIAAGFLLGGVLGAIGATRVSSSSLQWCYVVYLALLNALLILRSSAKRPETPLPGTASLAPVTLIGAGLLAGLSSGFLGIGGGLAIVVVLSSGLKVPQHQAQLISLIVSIIPTTLPAAYIYGRAGQLASWPILLSVIVGLWIGTDLGARIANRLKSIMPRRTLIVTVATMAVYMAWQAMGH